MPTKHGARFAKCSRNFSRLSWTLLIFPLSSTQCNERHVLRYLHQSRDCSLPILRLISRRSHYLTGERSSIPFPNDTPRTPRIDINRASGDGPCPAGTDGHLRRVARPPSTGIPLVDRCRRQL